MLSTNIIKMKYLAKNIFKVKKKSKMFHMLEETPQFPADLVTFTEEILNEKLHFLCGEI